MPKTCRTDTFISGKPTGSLTWLMAAVVINPPRSRAFPKPDLLNGCGWVLAANLAESNGWQKPAAQSKFQCLIIEIGAELGFWRAALRITPYFCRRAGSPTGGLHLRNGHFPPPWRVVRSEPSANRGTETGFL